MGGELSLWNPLLLDWLVWMKQSKPEIAVHAHVGVPDQLIDQLRTGVLDIAVLYAPKLLPGFRVELLQEEQLVLVRTRSSGNEAADASSYVYVDWGPLFAAQHDASSTAFGEPGLMIGLGPLALNYILRAGGMGYFRRGSIAPHVASGELEIVEGEPEFTYPAYAVYPENNEGRPDVLDALRGLKEVVG